MIQYLVALFQYYLVVHSTIIEDELGLSIQYDKTMKVAYKMGWRREDVSFLLLSGRIFTKRLRARSILKVQDRLYGIGQAFLFFLQLQKVENFALQWQSTVTKKLPLFEFLAGDYAPLKCEHREMFRSTIQEDITHQVVLSNGEVNRL